MVLFSGGVELLLLQAANKTTADKKEKINAIYIATPPAFHGEICTLMICKRQYLI
jgi:hypothetical protein